MKIFLTGATGAVSRRLVPLLVGAGHQVVATTRSPNKIEGLRAAGAAPVVVDALDGIFNIVDDEPAEVSVWLPDLARAIGAKPPYHLPAWLGRMAIGDAGMSMMTKPRGSSNAKAKRLLGWQPMYPSWRDGFRRGFAPELARPTR